MNLSGPSKAKRTFSGIATELQLNQTPSLLPLQQESGLSPGQSSPHRALVLLPQRGPSPERVDAVHGHEELEGAAVTLLLDLPQHHPHGVTGTPDTSQTLQGAQGTALSLDFLLVDDAGGSWAALPWGKTN